MTFRHRFDHKRRDSSDNLTMHWTEFKVRPFKRLVVDRRIYLHRAWVIKNLHKVSSFIGSKLVMGPEGIIKSEIPELFLIALIEESGGGSDHIDA